MEHYFWKGIDSKNKFRKGEIRALDKEDALLSLHKRNIAPFVLRKIYIVTKPSQQKKIKLRYIIVFTKKLESMLKAKINILDSLKMLTDQEKNRHFKKVIDGLKTSVEEGATFSTALEKYHQVFDIAYINIVKAGEKSGNISSSLNEIAKYMLKMEKLKNNIKRSLSYPFIISVVALILFFFILFFVVPSFATIFGKEGTDLPYATSLLLNFSNFLTQNLFYISICAVLIIFLSHHFYKSRFGGKFIYGLIFKMPFFGDIYKKSTIARFSRTMNSMLKVNVTVLNCLKTTLKTTANKKFQDILKKVVTNIETGHSLSNAMEQTTFFPMMIPSMISIGEKNNQITEMFIKIAFFYEDELDEKTAFLSKTIEPIMMLIIGLIIGLILLVMYLPIFKIAETIVI